MQNKRWIIAEQTGEVADLAVLLKTAPLIAQVLCNRGILNPAECLGFLSPSLSQLIEPRLLPGVLKAAERICCAIRAGEKIVIYGDYDVDGITATAILWHAIRLLGGDVDYYIPHRIDEGYGLNAAALKEIIERGAQLIVTVDCGVTAVEPVKAASERGIDLIITDHHQWHEAKDERGSVKYE